jgi:uncharacterized membrane protein YdbT with pleckstrin-like domain
MKYVQRVLQTGEAVRYASTVHWVVYLPSIILLVLGAIGLAALGESRVNPPGVVPLPLSLIVAGVGFVAGLLAFIPALAKRRTTELAVTNRRVIYKRGFIRRHTIEMNMDKVESVDVDQSFWGRIFNYGTIVVHGTGGSLEPLETIGSPIDFRNEVTAH